MKTRGPKLRPMRPATVKKFGAPKPELPHHYAALIAKEDQRIVKLTRELLALRRRVDRAKMRKSVLMRLANDELRRGAQL